MDGSIILLIQIPVTVISVAIGFWQVHERLRDKIDTVKDEAIAAKNASKNVETKMQGFIDTCQAYREAFDKRITRVEKTENSRRQ